MAKFSIRLRELRNSKDLSQQQFADKMGISKSSINMYERGEREPGLEMLENMADFFNVDLDYLLGKSDVPNMSLELLQRSIQLPDNIIPYNPIVHQIPILGAISAGLPLYAEQHIEGYTYTDRNGGAEYFALKVKGDSMNAAKINDGDILIIRRQEEVENGDIAVIMVNKENATVKRFKRDNTIVQLIPQSYNAEHEIQIYDLKKDKINIIGKVVECKIEFQ